MHSSETSSGHYIKIWVILLILLVISLVGPTIGIRAITILSAFGIAIVKAYLVARHFMHLAIEKKFITYMLVSMVLLAFLFFFGSAPDIMKPQGQFWEKTSFSSTPKHGQ